MVEFYYKWCGYCNAFAPEYSYAASVLSTIEPSIPLARVDIDKQKPLANRFGIPGAPTVLWFVN